MAAHDSIDFSHWIEETKYTCRHIDNGNVFMTYFNQSLVPLLRDGVFEPNQKYGIGYRYNWTNNNMESMNHVLKTAVDWKPRPLPDLIVKVWDVVKAQQKGLRCALVGRGNYVLCEDCAYYRVSTDEWAAMSRERKERTVNDFIRDKQKKHSNRVTSTNGKLEVLTTPSRGKYPGQRKREIDERSHSIAKHVRFNAGPHCHCFTAP